jgi:predicted RNA-binding protein
MEHLKRFSGDAHIKASLMEFIEAFIAEEALKRVYDRQSVAHIPDAMELIKKAFESLDLKFTVRKEKEITNESR